MSTKELKYFDRKVDLTKEGRMRLIDLMSFSLFSPTSVSLKASFFFFI